MNIESIVLAILVIVGAYVWLSFPRVFSLGGLFIFLVTVDKYPMTKVESEIFTAACAFMVYLLFRVGVLDINDLIRYKKDNAGNPQEEKDGHNN